MTSSKPNLGILSLTGILLICAVLASCKPREIPVACAPLPIVDGFETAMTKGGKMTLRLPKHAARLTEDCKQIDWAVLDYFWHNGKLINRTVENQYDTGDSGVANKHVIQVYPQSFVLISEVAPATLKSWQFDDPVRHYKYPLEFYPKFFWAGPDKAPAKAPPDVMWGVSRVKEPFSAHPHTTLCSIVRGVNETQADVVKGDFSKDNGDAKCRGGITAIKGDKVVFGLIDVYADNVQNIDQIYKAVIAEIQTYIQE